MPDPSPALPLRKHGARDRPGRFDVAVVGAGVVGCSTAYALYRAGYHVVLIERRDAPALETSYANAGLVTPSMSDPWAAPGLPRYLLKSLGREGSAFLLRAKALPGMLRWGPRFLGNCTRPRWAENTRRLVELSLDSQRRLNAVAQSEGLGTLLHSRGTLRLLADDTSLRAAERVASIMGCLGIRFQVLDRAGCLALDPALAALASSWHGGIHYPDDQHGDCRAFTLALLARCPGLAIRCSTTFTGVSDRSAERLTVQTSAGSLQAGHVVLCCAFPRQLGRTWALRLPPVYPVKGYSLTFEGAAGVQLPKVPIIDEKRKVGLVHLGDRIRVAGTAEFCGHDRTLNSRRVAALRDTTLALLPALATLREAEVWSGLRPMTPSGFPAVGRGRDPRLLYNIGHGHLGWTCAMGTAERVRRLIENGDPKTSKSRLLTDGAPSTHGTIASSDHECDSLQPLWENADAARTI